MVAVHTGLVIESDSKRRHAPLQMFDANPDDAALRTKRKLAPVSASESKRRLCRSVIASPAEAPTHARGLLGCFYLPTAGSTVDDVSDRTLQFVQDYNMAVTPVRSVVLVVWAWCGVAWRGVAWRGVKTVIPGSSAWSCAALSDRDCRDHRAGVGAQRQGDVLAAQGANRGVCTASVRVACSVLCALCSVLCAPCCS